MKFREGLMGVAKTGIVGLPIGLFFLAIAAFGFAEGADVTLPFDSIEVNVLTATGIGVLFLFMGIATIFFLLKPSAPIQIILIMTSCALIIPATFLGIGEKIVGGLLANVFGYATLFWIFIWLTTEELDVGTIRRLVIITTFAIAFGSGFAFGVDFGHKLLYPD